MGLFHFLLAPGLHDERIGHQLPKVLRLDTEIEFLGEALHDLVAAIVAGGNHHFGPCVHDLFRLHSAVIDSFFGIGQCPGATACAAAIVVHPVGVHFYRVFAALLNDPSRLLEIAVAESLLALAAVIAGIMDSREVFVDGFIQLDSSRLYVFLQEIVDRDDLVFLENFGKPVLQTKPGRIVGMASLG